jgi:tetratricopeptide (TPR) repeat protein
MMTLLLLTSFLQVAWQKDEAAAIQKAKASGTLALIHFESAWCGMCNRMSAETFADEDVVKATAAFACARVEVDKDAASWKNVYGCTVHPETVIVTGEGEIVSRIVDFRAAKAFAASLASIPERVKKLRIAEAKTGDEGLLEAAAAKMELENPAGAALVYRKIVANAGETASKAVAIAAAKLAQRRSDEELWDEVEPLAALFEKHDKENGTGLAAELVLPRVFVLFFGRQQPDSALRALQAAEKMHPTSKLLDRWMFLEGTMLKERGERDAAVEVWKKAAEQFPETEWGRRAKKMTAKPD